MSVPVSLVSEGSVSGGVTESVEISVVSPGVGSFVPAESELQAVWVTKMMQQTVSRNRLRSTRKSWLMGVPY